MVALCFALLLVAGNVNLKAYSSFSPPRDIIIKLAYDAFCLEDPICIDSPLVYFLFYAFILENVLG